MPVVTPNQTTGLWHSVWYRLRRHWPFALSVAAPAAKSKSAMRAGFLAFDFAALRSGRTEIASAAGEEVYQYCVVRTAVTARLCLSIRAQALPGHERQKLDSRLHGNDDLCRCPPVSALTLSAHTMVNSERQANRNFSPRKVWLSRQVGQPLAQFVYQERSAQVLSRHPFQVWTGPLYSLLLVIPWPRGKKESVSPEPLPSAHFADSVPCALGAL
jgi:hypothetical protein